MANGAMYGRLVDRGNNRHMSAFMGPSNSKERLFFYPNSVDTVYVREDFAGTSFASSGLSMAATPGGTAFAIGTGSSTGFGGTIVGAATTTSEVISITGTGIWTPAKNCGMHVRFQVASNTNLQFEMGFQDTISSSVAMTVTDIDVPTIGNGAANAALVAMDTSQTLKTMALCVLGSQASGSATSASIVHAVTGAALAPTAATYMDVVVQTIFQDSTHADVVTVINNNANYTTFLGATAAKQINSACALFPWLAFQNVTTTNASFKVTIDMVEFWQDR